MDMVRAPVFGVAQNNLAATPTTAGAGTTITAGAANTKGSWAQLFAATNFDVYGITLLITNNSTSALVRNWLFDLGIGPSAEQPIVSNLMGTGNTNLTSGPTGPHYFLPIFIPKGTRVVARAQCSTASATANITAWLQGGPSNVPWRAFAGAEGIGINTAASAGTAITAGSPAGTESAWTSIGSTTARAYGAIKLMVGTDVSTAVNNAAYHAEWGYSSTTLGESLFFSNNVENVGGLYPLQPDYVQIPVGTQLQVRTESSLATGEALQYGLLGFF